MGHCTTKVQVVVEMAVEFQWTSSTTGSGGSGVVIISYAGSQAFTGGTVTTSGGNTIHTFTASGSLTGAI
jgi:hypothetical protein